MRVLADPAALLWFGLCGLSCVLLARRQWRRAWVVLACVAAACAVEAARLPRRLVAGLERPFVRQAGAPTEPADAVAVLGGSVKPSTNNILGLGFGDTADRLITGIALVRQGKGRVLVLSGGGRGVPPGTGVPVEVQGARDWIRSWGLAPAPVEVLDWCLDTHEEALRHANLARKNGWKKVILVTSAWHMKRAAAAFRKAGLEVVPVACDFRGIPGRLESHRLSWVPRTGTLVLLDLWMEETAGYLYYRLRSWA